MKNALKFALLGAVLLILCPVWVFSQPESVRWVRIAGGHLDDAATGVAVDAKLLVGAGIFSNNDFRPDGLATTTWRINIQEGACGYPIMLSWENATLPAGVFRLKDVFSDGGQFDIDMKTQGSLTVDNAAITQFRIEYQQDVSAVNDANPSPRDFTLHANFPNPFNPATTITYELQKPAIVLLAIFDPMGRKIRTLVNTRLTTGFYSVDWDGRDDNGQIVSSGVYFYRMQTRKKDIKSTRKMVLLQ